MLLLANAGAGAGVSAGVSAAAGDLQHGRGADDGDGLRFHVRILDIGAALGNRWRQRLICPWLRHRPASPRRKQRRDEKKPVKKSETESRMKSGMKTGVKMKIKITSHG